jgi:hypothetical protein
LPTSKKICQLKKSSSPTVWHNSLVKSIFNLHQKPERETKLFYALPPLENLHKEPEKQNYFLHPSTSSATEGCATDARAYMHAPRGGIPSCYWCQVVLTNCWKLIFHIFPKLDGCQVKIANCWSYSYMCVRYDVH